VRPAQARLGRAAGGVRMSATKTKWVVRCDDYTSRPFSTEQAAVHTAESIAELGECQHDHEVIEVER
jgi:hypothetical protein